MIFRKRQLNKLKVRKLCTYFSHSCIHSNERILTINFFFHQFCRSYLLRSGHFLIKNVIKSRLWSWSIVVLSLLQLFNIGHNAHFRNSGHGRAEHPETLLPLISTLLLNRLTILCLQVVLNLKVVINLCIVSVLSCTGDFEGLEAPSYRKVNNGESEAHHGRNVRSCPKAYSFRDKRTICWCYHLTKAEERIEDSCR